MTLWVALVVLVAFSAFFSASETAFSSLNQIRLKSRAEDGDTSAARQFFNEPPAKRRLE